jgi:hypothetical protein
LAAICCALPPSSTRTSSGFITPGLIPASASICRPSIAVPLPGKFLSCDSFAFSCVPKPTRTATIAIPTAATQTGRRSTRRAHRPQAPSSGCPRSTSRRGSTRTLLIFVPSVARSAGSRVIAASTETAGMSMPPIPIERMNGSGSTIIERSPTATVDPETITDRPAWVIVWTSAVSTSSPSRSSSRKRKIISSA